MNLLETISAGRIYVQEDLIGYKEANGRLHDLYTKAIAAQRREIGMVFQRFNLFPHKTALANIMEAPTQVKRQSNAAAPRPWTCWRGSGWPTGRTTTRPSSPAGSNSASRSPAPWPWSRN